MMLATHVLLILDQFTFSCGSNGNKQLRSWGCLTFGVASGPFKCHSVLWCGHIVLWMILKIGKDHI